MQAAPTANEIVELLRQTLAGHTLVIAPTLPRSVESPFSAILSFTFKLTKSESLALMKLLQGGPVSREDLRTGKGGSRAVDVLIWSMRRKLKPHGIGIETLHGQGFVLAKGAGDKVRARLTGQAAKTDPSP